ncbi:T3SS (YopN, CesT) and YbjN peptide-binding chaperone 1 [Rhodococcus rhodochrous]|uniref:T3SS (YopN, CesT) and YbjN peptide-binding chaperone 1 n=1 Tax=Rhodococcus rhodochrous TaxID=1829 RepID=UPI0020B14D82|nr:hypothetical protein [Rhodococcus rhodochrous]
MLVEDRLVATVDLLGDPFVPRHLSELLQRLKGFLTVVDERFARRFDGVRYGSDREHDVELPRAACSTNRTELELLSASWGATAGRSSAPA